MTGKEVILVLMRNGWNLDRITGSLHILSKPGWGSISVPLHGSKDLKNGTLHRILKDAGIKRK